MQCASCSLHSPEDSWIHQMDSGGGRVLRGRDVMDLFRRAATNETGAGATIAFASTNARRTELVTLVGTEGQQRHRSLPGCVVGPILKPSGYNRRGCESITPAAGEAIPQLLRNLTEPSRTLRRTLRFAHARLRQRTQHALVHLCTTNIQRCWICSLS